jgi:DNA-binding beta-propeller fold protein YncE
MGTTALQTVTVVGRIIRGQAPGRRRWGAMLALVVLAALLRAGPPPTADARVHWTVEVPEEPVAAAVDMRRAQIVVATGGAYGGGQLQFLALSTGVSQGEVPLPASPVGLALDARTDRVFVVSGSPRVTVFAAQNGALVGTTPLPGAAVAVVADEHTGRVFVACTGLADPWQGSVNMLDARSLRLLRTIPVETYPTLLAVDGPSGRVVLTNVTAQGTGVLRVLDGRSGQVLRAFPLGDAATALGLAAWRGLAFIVAGGTPSLTVLDERTGVVRRRLQLGVAPYALAVADAAGALVVAGADPRDSTAGAVQVVDAQSGTPGASVPVDDAPLAIAVTGLPLHVVVASGPALVPGPSPRWHAWLPPSLMRWLPLLRGAPGAPHFVSGRVHLLAP